MTDPVRDSAWIVQAYRWVRTCIHAFAGVGTTMFVFPWVSPERRRALVKRWSIRLLRIVAVELRVTGEAALHEGNVLLVSNHVSWLDIFVLNAVHPVRFVGKIELTQWPVVSQMIRGAGTIFIERERRRDTRRVNQQMAALLAGGDVVAIFPEGTTTDGRELLPFKSSLLQPIVEARGHVQPVALRYKNKDGTLSAHVAYVGATTFAQSFWMICGARRLIVDFVALPALPADGRSRRDLARDAEAAIRTVLPGPAAATEPGTRGDRTA